MLRDLYTAIAGQWQTSSWPARVSSPLPAPPQPLYNRTSSFYFLYDRVTKRFEQHALQRSWGPEDALYTDYLIAGFHQQYLRWLDPPAAGRTCNSRDYLREFDHASIWMALQTVACAYLHVSYDLPRVIADSFRDVEPAVGVSRSDIEARFIELEDALRDVLHTTATSRAVMGRLAVLMNFVPQRKYFLDVFANWVLNLRSNAMIQARTLALDPNGRPFLEDRLLSRMIDAAHGVVTRHRRNPAAWLSGLRTMGLGLAVVPPMAVLAQVTVLDTSQALWITLWVTLGMGAVTLLVAYLYLWAVNRSLAAFADDLGLELQRAMSVEGGGDVSQGV